MTDYVALRCVGTSVSLRELTGADERTVAGTSTETAVALLDRLLGPGGPTAADLAAADRDRLLAALHRRTFGDRVEATIACLACDERFDLDFTLSALEAALDERTAGAAFAREPNGVFRVAGRGRFRLPTGADELAVAALGSAAAPAALLERCAMDPAGATGFHELKDLLEQVAPLLDLELDATCPECGVAQPVHFDIQSFCLGSLLAERPRLLEDIHRLAMSYCWSAEEILALPRGERRALAALAERQAG